MKNLNDFDSGGDDGEDWLVSYADMMTLIACFFILLMAFANYDPAGFNEKAKKLSEYFKKDKNKSSSTKLVKMQEEIVNHPEIRKMAKVSLKDSSLVITFSGTTLFKSGQWKLDTNVRMVLDAMVDIIKSQDSSYRILVEGHSDGVTDTTTSNLKTDWLISSARSASIISRFEYFGFNPRNLVSVGYGATQPLEPSFDKEGKVIEENLASNRRAVIKVLSPIKEKKKVKLGLGVYFEDSKSDQEVEERFTEGEFK